MLLVDDEAFVRHALRAYMADADDIQIVGEAADGREAIELARQLGPDLVLMDLQMPNLDGVAATRQILEHQPGTRVLVVTGHVDDSFVIDSLLAGASGYVVKDAEPERFITAIRGVLAGEQPIDPSVTQHLIAQLHHADIPGSPATDSPELTDREKEVLERLCEGKSNKEIARSMYIAETTVKYHLVALMRKLDARGRVELVVTALRQGIVT